MTPAASLFQNRVMPRVLSAVLLLTACSWPAAADDYEIGPGDVLHVIVLEQVGLTGEFKSPGPYSLKADRSLLALLTQVGEVTLNAGHEVMVIRPPGPDFAPSLTETPASPSVGSSRPGPPLPGEVPGSEVFRISLRELKAGYPEKNILLQAKDTVYLPKASQVYVLGHVARPGAYRYEEGMTVFQAVLLAGGVTERGSSKGVKILRLVEGKSKELKPRMDELVLPEDTIRVPERFF